MLDYRFRCLGPFYFTSYKDKRGRRLFDPAAARDEVFEAAAEVQHRVGIDDIGEAIGLYMMGMAPRGKHIPFYVGKAARQTIHARLFQKQDKPAKFGAILNEYERARPFVYLFPMVTSSGRLVRKPTAEIIGTGAAEKVIANAEHMMIGQAMHVNPWLHNISTVIARERFVIDGSPAATGNETQFAKSFRSMMGFTKPTSASDKLRESIADAVEHEDRYEKQMDEALSHPEFLEAEELPSEDCVAGPES